jgi:epoxide hydrolase-like predicted phosphatase
MTSGRRFDALIVDYGGVLTTSMTASFAAFCVANDVDPRHLKRVLAEAYPSEPGAGAGPGGDLSDLVASVETGRLGLEEFDARLATLLSEGRAEPLEAADLTMRLFGGLLPDQAMVAAVRRAKEAGLRTGLLSNTWGPRGAPSVDEELFDAIVRSGDVGLRKPDPAIYLLTAERLGAEPERCVFVDDIPANVEGARAAGMTATLHKHAAITLPALEALLEVALTIPPTGGGSSDAGAGTSSS